METIDFVLFISTTNVILILKSVHLYFGPFCNFFFYLFNFFSTLEQIDIIAGISNVKHEAASGHDFLDRLGLIINKNKDDTIDPSLLGLADRSVEKLIKVRYCNLFVRVVATRSFLLFLAFQIYFCGFMERNGSELKILLAFY